MGLHVIASKRHRLLQYIRRVAPYTAVQEVVALVVSCVVTVVELFQQLQSKVAISLNKENYSIVA